MINSTSFQNRYTEYYRSKDTETNNLPFDHTNATRQTQLHKIRMVPAEISENVIGQLIDDGCLAVEQSDAPIKVAAALKLKIAG